MFTMLMYFINYNYTYDWSFFYHQGGGVVRLFHCESECYISAEGSFALSNDDIEDIDGIPL